jgi:hypothetical protein
MCLLIDKQNIQFIFDTVPYVVATFYYYGMGNKLVIHNPDFLSL